MPWRLASPGRVPDSGSVAQSEIHRSFALEADRSRQTSPGRIAHSGRETDAIPQTQTFAFALSFRLTGFLRFSVTLFFPFAQSFQDEKPAAA